MVGPEHPAGERPGGRGHGVDLAVVGDAAEAARREVPVQAAAAQHVEQLRAAAQPRTGRSARSAPRSAARSRRSR